MLLYNIIYITNAESARVELTPGSITACPNQEIVIYCVYTVSEADRNYTRWTVTPEDNNSPPVELSLTALQNINQRYVVEAETTILVEWTSFSPLSSTLTTNATPALDGAIVNCIFSNSMRDSLTISIIGISLAEAMSFCTVNSVISIIYQLYPSCIGSTQLVKLHKWIM